MISRNERGKLTVNQLDMAVMFDELFEKCQTEDEVEWLNELLISSSEQAMEEKLERLKS